MNDARYLEEFIQVFDCKNRVHLKNLRAEWVGVNEWINSEWERHTRQRCKAEVGMSLSISCRSRFCADEQSGILRPCCKSGSSPEKTHRKFEITQKIGVVSWQVSAIWRQEKKRGARGCLAIAEFTCTGGGTVGRCLASDCHAGPAWPKRRVDKLWRLRRLRPQTRHLRTCMSTEVENPKLWLYRACGVWPHHRPWTCSLKVEAAARTATLTDTHTHTDTDTHTHSLTLILTHTRTLKQTHWLTHTEHTNMRLRHNVPYFTAHTGGIIINYYYY